MLEIRLQAYKFALDPNEEQEHLLRGHAGARRYAFNWARGFYLAAVNQRAAEESYGITEDRPFPPAKRERERLAAAGTPWTEPAPPPLGWRTPLPRSMENFRDAWNSSKHYDPARSWWNSYSKESFCAGFAGFADALKNYRDSQRGVRKGKAVGFPKLKKKGKARDSYAYSTGPFGPDGDRRFRLPRVGSVRTHESLAVLAGARIKNVTVSRTADRWFVSCCVEVAREIPAGPSRRQQRGGVVGVDLGVKVFATLSTGETVQAGQRQKSALGRLKKASRALSRAQEGSNGWYQRKRQVARAQAKIAAARADDLHKLTTWLARNHEVVSVEDLNVAGMVRNHHLARAVADAGFGEFRRQLTYKCGAVIDSGAGSKHKTEYRPGWYGSHLHVVPRFYPSSKTCSGCGWRKPNLKLSERTYHCAKCGLSMDRDLNAAINLRQHALDHMSSASTAQSARGVPVRPKAVAWPCFPARHVEAGSCPPHGEASSSTRQLVVAS